MKPPLDWIDDELEKLEGAQLRRRLVTRSSPQAAVVRIGDRTLANFASNDYLGLAQEDPRPVLGSALADSGWGAGASPLVSGRSSWHAALEEDLAAFEGTEQALLFTSGYAANVGAITALAAQGDVIYSDAKNHASIIDGCRLSGARIEVYPHRDTSRLRELLGAGRRFRRRLVVTDSLFSMDGDLAPLADLAEIAEDHEAMLMVDEAHATGVFGEQGRGLAEQLDVEDGVHIRVGTLSKALGSMGGFVAGSQSLCDWLSNRARTYVYSTAAPAALAAAGRRALGIVRDQPERRRTLLQRAAEMRQRLRSQGWSLGDAASQIIPVFLAEPDRTMRAATQLADRGLLVPGIRPPSVPPGQSLLRVSLSYAHTPDMLDALLAALGELQRSPPAV